MSARRVYPKLNRRGFALPLIIIAILLPIIILAAWAPWVTDNFSQNRLKIYNPCPQLLVVPNFKTPSPSQKVPFGRKLLKTESACGIYDIFVSALGTVHQIKVYKIDMSGTSDPVSCFLPEGCSDGSYPSAQKSPDETVNSDQVGANWKIYTVEKALGNFQPGEKYKYTVKYPSDWTFQENGSTTYFLPPGVGFEKNNIKNGIYISVRDNRSTRPPVNITYKTLREVKIENETAKVLQAENLATEKYLVEIARSFYMIRFSFSQYLDSKYDGIFDQILSTFKFLD